MENVPGIRSLRLNGETVAAIRAERSEFEIELEIADLAPRNVLILEIEPPDQMARLAGGYAEWGNIALIIRERHTESPLRSRGANDST